MPIFDRIKSINSAPDFLSEVTMSQKILYVLPKELTFDAVAAVCGLSECFPEAKHTIFSASQIPDTFKTVLDLTKFTISESLPENQIVININKQDGNVKSVKWLQNEEKIQFFLTLEKNAFKLKDIDFTSTEIYDLVAVVGCREFADSGINEIDAKYLLDNAKVINIDNHLENKNFGNIVLKKNDSSLSSLILEYIEENNLKLSQGAVNSLFKGILWSNDGFRNNPEFRRFTKKIEKFDEGLLEATEQMYSSVGIAELRYIGKIISNMQILSEGIVYSVLKTNDIQGLDEKFCDIS